MPSLPGPRLPPRSGRTRQLVVILHGFGADGTDLIELGRAWQPILPDAAFFAPHAPEPCIAGGGGRQWFPLTFRDMGERWRGVVAARPGLDQLIDAELSATGLDESRLALVGFSQGCMMALHVGLRRSRPIAGILGLSGMLVTDDALSPDEAIASIARHATAPPPVLLIHGERDDVIPAEALAASANLLAAAGIACEWHLSPRLGHGIDEAGLRHGGLFLAGVFAPRPGPR